MNIILLFNSNKNKIPLGGDKVTILSKMSPFKELNYS